MKKLLILAAVAAMACGAWADGLSYTYTLTIWGFDAPKETLPTDLVAQIFDPAVGKDPVAVLTLDNLVPETETLKPIQWNDLSSKGKDWAVTATLAFVSPSLLSPENNNMTAIVTSWSSGYYQYVNVTENAGVMSIGSNASFQNVPEPTSGLLMLLGLAGLALKRKRA